MPDLPPSLVVLAVLAEGVVLAAVSRLILPGSRRLAWGTVVVVAMLGAGLAWIPVDLFVATPTGIVRLVVGLVGALAAVAIASAILVARARLAARGSPEATVGELIAAGEGERLELKSTARWNTKSGARDVRMEDEVAVTVAAFMNASGGTLLLGVDDDGTVRGHEPEEGDRVRCLGDTDAQQGRGRGVRETEDRHGPQHDPSTIANA
jgi:hypothetical protein